MAKCISAQWHLDPLFIREGGSVPSLPFLEQEFGAHAVHFPIGTSSDNAHLPNERIRVLNLEVRAVLGLSRCFKVLTSFCPGSTVKLLSRSGSPGSPRSDLSLSTSHTSIP